MNKGFSLVELLVVVAIIGVLASVGVVGYDRYVESTKLKVLQQNYDKIRRFMETEWTIVSNGLGSAVKEYDVDGMATGELLNPDTTCREFLVSMKQYFLSGIDGNAFKNPWKLDKNMISIDNQSWSAHKKGSIQFFCYKSTGGYGQGDGCKLDKARFRVIMHQDPQGTDDGVQNHVHYTYGGTYFDSAQGGVDAAKIDCDWDQDIHGDWRVGSDQIDTDATW